MTKNHYVLVLDIESTGKEIMAIGATVKCIENGAEVSSFLTYVKPEAESGFVWDEKWKGATWDENKQIRDDILRNVDETGVPSKKAMENLRSWARSLREGVRAECTVFAEEQSTVALLDAYFLKHGLPDCTGLLCDYRPTMHARSYYAGVSMLLPNEWRWNTAKNVLVGKDPYPDFPEGEDPLSSAIITACELCAVIKYVKHKREKMLEQTK